MSDATTSTQQLDDDSIKRQRASYKSQESQVTIDGKAYRALVIQTDHLDKRRSNAIERNHAKEKHLIEKTIKAAKKTSYHCPSVLPT